jgi:hypothetical protein
MTSNGLRAQYLIPNLSLSAIAYPSIRPFRSGHVITQSRKISANNLPAERKQIADRGLLFRIFLKKPSFSQTNFSPSWAHKSDSFLYQILVLTSSSWFNEFWWTITWLWSAHEVFLLSPKSCANSWSESGDWELDLGELTRGCCSSRAA